MARQLWLLRHAEAEPHGSREDSARRLTARGEAQARAAGAALLALEAGFEEILYSPKARARETAELALEGQEPRVRDGARAHEPLAARLRRGRRARAGRCARPPTGDCCWWATSPTSRPSWRSSRARASTSRRADVAVMRLEGGGGELALLLRPRELALIAQAGTVPAAAAVRALG